MRREAMEDEGDMEGDGERTEEGSGRGDVLMAERIINWRQLSRPRGRRRHGTEEGRRPWGWDQSPPPGPAERQRPFGPALQCHHLPPGLHRVSSSPLALSCARFSLEPMAVEWSSQHLSRKQPLTLVCRYQHYWQ
jgi:hypothetical protein